MVGQANEAATRAKYYWGGTAHWTGYALFNYDATSDKFTADPSPSDCGHACHVAVKVKDHIFHPYQKR